MKRFYVKRKQDETIFKVLGVSYKGWLLVNILTKEFLFVKDKKLKEEFVYASKI